MWIFPYHAILVLMAMNCVCFMSNKILFCSIIYHINKPLFYNVTILFLRYRHVK